MEKTSLRERNRQRVTQRIVAAASELFKTQGYHSTTMDDIAEKAEISRGTLFNYFPSKETLLLPWGQEILEQHIQPRLQAYLKAQPATVQVFQFVFTLMSENIRALPDVVLAMVHEALNPSNLDHSSQMGFTETGIRKIFVEILHYGQERGEVRMDIPLENIASYLSALQTALFFRLLETTTLEDAALEIDAMAMFIERGISIRR